MGEGQAFAVKPGMIMVIMKKQAFKRQCSGRTKEFAEFDEGSKRSMER
jgi:hypothetical protein